MRSATDFTNRCVRCHVRRDLCICAGIPTLRARTRVVVVRHALESFRSTNTARIAMLALPDAELVEFGGRSPMVWPDPPQAALLFPDGAAPIREPPKTIVLVDGSWSQARRMVHRLAPIRALPRLVVSPSGEALPRLRIPTRPDGMSTIEALSAALMQLGDEETAHALAELCRLHATRSLEAKGLF